MATGKGILLGFPRRWEEACFAIPALRALEKSGFLQAIVAHEEQTKMLNLISKLPQITYGDATRTKNLAREIGKNWTASLVWEKGLLAEAFTKAGIPKRLGPEEEIPKKQLTHPLDIKEGPTEHRVRRYLKTCELMGIPMANPDYFAPLNLGVAFQSKTILLCPDSDFGKSYEWELEKWQQLGQALRNSHYQLAIAALPQIKGRELSKNLAKALGGEIDLLTIDPKSGAFHQLASYACTVTADSSLAHLAALSNSTCVTLFGPNDATWKRPLGKKHLVVKRHAECAPCLSPKCLLDRRCQTELEVSTVTEAIFSLNL